MCDGVGEMVETAVVSLDTDDADNRNERGDGDDGAESENQR